MLNSINTAISEVMGPFGLINNLGVLAATLGMATGGKMIRQPEDPLDKLKRSQTTSRSGADGMQETLRQKDGNAQLEKFATFLEPSDDKELSKKHHEHRQAGYQLRDAVSIFHFAQMTLGLIGLAIGVVYTNFIVEVEMKTQQHKM